MGAEEELMNQPFKTAARTDRQNKAGAEVGGRSLELKEAERLYEQRREAAGLVTASGSEGGQASEPRTSDTIGLDL